ncbi:MAG TPA: protease inhibitor I42 family protein [Anaerolineales bacterium]|nr:protease inhibitor I42 family protein [Anaerolineales bacterium]
MKRICFLLIAAILLTGCAAFSFTPTPTLPTIPTDVTPNSLPEPTDPTQLITVGAGETFDIVLPSNSSTGYRWNLVGELDETVVQFVSQNYMAQEPVIPGSGGVDVWTFRAVNTGDTTIELGYYPPSSDTEPDETVTFSIQVLVIVRSNT